MRRMAGVVAVAALTSGAAPAPDWRPLDPENTLVIETTKGRIVVEMAPLVAPKAVERVKLLAREHVYDGLQFHRVLEGFVAQTGNRTTETAGSPAIRTCRRSSSSGCRRTRSAWWSAAATGKRGSSGRRR
jgi:peptidylprolyl isomerase